MTVPHTDEKGDKRNTYKLERAVQRATALAEARMWETRMKEAHGQVADALAHLRFVTGQWGEALRKTGEGE